VWYPVLDHAHGDRRHYPTLDLMSAVASDEVLEQAFDWLCQRRRDYSPYQDVWHVRWRWHQRKPQLQQQLLQGTYRFGPVQRFGDGEDAREVWDARDALVLKAVALVLARYWTFSPRCHHVAGHGGAKAAVRAVDRALPDFPHVLRSDAKSYYASLDHELLLAQLRDAIADPRLLTLLEKYVRRTIYQDGLYRDVTQGISLGCPLSPLIAALYLKPLDPSAWRRPACSTPASWTTGWCWRRRAGSCAGPRGSCSRRSPS
jgi:RNA-directed DNA polymerase